jgi:single-stranded-DNA-specific exonuclease
MPQNPEPARDPQALFASALQSFPPQRPLLVMGHNDADGLSATAIFARALGAAGWGVETRTLGRGENPWSPELAAELQGAQPGALIVTDLGLRPGKLGPATMPVVIADHHVPQGFAEAELPGNTTVITGYGLDPIPTSSLIAWRCAAALADPAHLVWLAALGLVGDMADKDFPDVMAQAKPFGITAIRDAASLVNAPRRAASGDAAPALTLLMKAENPKDVLNGRYPETEALLAAKAEVKEALDAAKRIPPRVAGDVALIRFSTPCQIHPLVAQSWRGRLKDKIVIAANEGYRSGWVHFAARTATGANLIAFFAAHKPAGADEHYGGGHVQASGGALKPEQWRAFLDSIGFPAKRRDAA